MAIDLSKNTDTRMTRQQACEVLREVIRSLEGGMCDAVQNGFTEGLAYVYMDDVDALKDVYDYIAAE